MKKIIALAVFLLSMALQSYGQTFWRQTQANMHLTYLFPRAHFKTGEGGVVCYTNDGVYEGGSKTFFINKYGDTTRTYNHLLDTLLIYTPDYHLYDAYGLVFEDTERYMAVASCVTRLNNGNYMFGCYPNDSNNIDKIKSVILTDSLGNVLRTRFFDDTVKYNSGGTFNECKRSQIKRIGNTDSAYFFYNEKQSFEDTTVASLGWTHERYFFNLYKLGPDLDTLWHLRYRYKIDCYSSCLYYSWHYNGYLDDVIFTSDGGVLISYYHDTDNNFSLNILGGSGYRVKNHLVKIDGNGNIVWQKNATDLIGVPTTDYYDIYPKFEMGDSSIVCEIKDNYSSTIRHMVRIDRNGNLLDSVSSFLSGGAAEAAFPIGYGKIVAPFIDGNHLMIFNKHFNHLETIPTPFPGVDISVARTFFENTTGGVFFSKYKEIDPTTHIVHFINFDSNFNVYPSKITGKVVLDRNNDCIHNAGDLIKPASLVAQEVGTDRYYYRFTNDSGNYSFSLPYGNYTITHPVSANKLTECGAYTTNVTEPIIYSGHDFYDTLVPGIKNFRVELFNSRMRPGDSCYLTTFLQNLGSVDVDSVLNIILDNRVAFVDANVTPTAISGDTLKYNLHLVPDSFYVIQLRIIPNTSLIVGDTLHFMAYSPFNNNVDPTSDSVFLDAPAFTAYDPNIKMANQPLYFPKNNDLVYTVCFQNTGNDTARRIVIEDTISSLLDIPTFMLLSSTHDTPEVKWTVGNKVQFIFKNIYLPDSNVNEPASHGSFSYKISPKATANEGDTILNTAYIYFDYNPAIITNTTVNILEKSRVSSVNHLTEQDKIIVYPNPTNGNAYIKLPSSITDVAITITDMSGRVVQQIERSQPTVEISLKEPPGIYLVKIVNKNNNAIYYKRITKY